MSNKKEIGRSDREKEREKEKESRAKGASAKRNRKEREHHGRASSERRTVVLKRLCDTYPIRSREHHDDQSGKERKHHEERGREVLPELWVLFQLSLMMF